MAHLDPGLALLSLAQHTAGRVPSSKGKLCKKEKEENVFSME